VKDPLGRHTIVYIHNSKMTSQIKTEAYGAMIPQERGIKGIVQFIMFYSPILESVGKMVRKPCDALLHANI
jgi:hypothetical protein